VLLWTARKKQGDGRPEKENIEKKIGDGFGWGAPIGVSERQGENINRGRKIGELEAKPGKKEGGKTVRGRAYYGWP